MGAVTCGVPRGAATHYPGLLRRVERVALNLRTCASGLSVANVSQVEALVSVAAPPASPVAKRCARR